MTPCTRQPCVCVQSAENQSGVDKTREQESQEGGLCAKSHTRPPTTNLSSSSSVESQSTSSRVTTILQSASRVLALCGGGVDG